MAEHIRRTPLDLPREALFRKSYSAVICSDGTLLPIEERLGRRLLRTLPPDCREARGLLKQGCVDLLTSDGRMLSGMTIDAVYRRLSSETSARLSENEANNEWRRRCRETLENIERWKRILSRDH